MWRRLRLLVSVATRTQRYSISKSSGDNVRSSIRRGGTGCPSGCLEGLLARRPLSALALIASGSVISWIASVESACGHPSVPLLLSLLQRCFMSAAGQRFRSLLVLRSYFLLPLSLSLSVSWPPWLNSNSSCLHLRWLVYSVLTAKHMMLTPSVNLTLTQ